MIWAELLKGLLSSGGGSGGGMMGGIGEMMGGGPASAGSANLGMGAGKGIDSSMIPVRGQNAGMQSDFMASQQAGSMDNAREQSQPIDPGGMPDPLQHDPNSDAFTKGFLNQHRRPIQRQKSQIRQSIGPSDQYIRSLLGG